MFLPLFLLTLGSGAAKADPFTGILYEPGSDRKTELYRVKGTERTEGNRKRIQTEFTGADGKAALSEEAHFEDGRLLSYRIDQKQVGETRLLRIEAGRAYFSTTRDGKTATDDESIDDRFIIGLTTVDYLRRNWDRILKGETLDSRFAVLERRETVGFKFFKTAEERRGDKDVVLVMMKPTSFVIAALVDPLVFVMTKDGSRLLELRGRLLPKRLRADGKWADQDYEAVYSY